MPALIRWSANGVIVDVIARSPNVIQTRIAFASILCALFSAACFGDESVLGPPDLIVNAQIDQRPNGGGSWLTGTVLKWEEASQPLYMPRSQSSAGTRIIYILQTKPINKHVSRLKFTTLDGKGAFPKS